MHKRSISSFRSWRRWPIPVCAAVLVLLAGCGTKGPELTPVSGKVTYGGGPWPKPGTLTFTSSERPGQAEFDAEGNFKAGSFAKGDGLRPGKYKVGVECWEIPPQIDRPGAQKSYVPNQYMNSGTSGFEITVESGKPQKSVTFDVPKK